MPSSAPREPRSFGRRILRGALIAPAALLSLACLAWASGALYFDFPRPGLRGPAAIVFPILALCVALSIRGTWKRIAVLFGAFLVVLAWWLTLQPSNDRDWPPEVAKTAWAEIDGDTVTIHNFRNFDYRTATDFTPRWETRTVHLSQLTGGDIFINFWGSPFMAHPQPASSSQTRLPSLSR